MEPFDSIARLHTAFMSAGHLSESILLTRGADGRQIVFTAVINRGEPQTIAGASKAKEAFAPFFEFWIPIGVLPANAPPNKASDRFSFATLEGGPASNHTVTAIIKQDATGWLVRCR